MRKAFLAALAVTAILLAGPQKLAANVKPETTLEMARACSGAQGEGSQRAAWVLYCIGFFDGLIGAWKGAILRGAAPVYCLPKSGIPLEQLMRVFVRWADEHPEKLHFPADIGLSAALTEAFPCS